MNRYPKYKPSNIQWLGNIPEHWFFSRLKYSLKKIVSGGTPSTSNPEYWDDEKGIPWVTISDISKSNGLLSDTERKITKKAILENRIDIVPKGTLLISIFASLGKTTFLNIDAAVNQAILGLITNDNVFIKSFLKYYLLFIENYISYYSSLNTQENLNLTKIRNIPVFFPIVSEQTTITNYLDNKTTQLDTLIYNKQKIIELLKEEKIAIVNNAVIKGINPNAKFEYCGVEWIGDIPNHWEIKKVKHVCKVQGRIGFKGYKSSDLVHESEGALTLGASHITRDHKINIIEPVFINWDKYYESPEIMVKKGDVVFTQRGAYLGKVAFIDKIYGEMTINPSLILLKDIIINGGYFTFYLTSNYIRKNIELISNNTAIPMISQEQLSSFYCLVPPISEQEEIFSFINSENSRIELTISKIEKEIQLLQEYRVALISEVVTGKVKVV